MGRLTMVGTRLANANTTNIRMHVPQTWEGSKNSTKFYDRKWRKARLEHLHLHPLCVDCLKEKKITEATEVDHIIPHRGDLTVFWDRTNWQSLCKPHHSAKTCRENGGFGNATS